MLTNVPTAVNRMARNVIINHPNTWECQLFRKRVTRVAPDTMGGLPTLGGLGVLDSEDEESIEYDHMGNGYALPADAFAPSPMMDHRDVNNGAIDEYRFMIEPEGLTGQEAWFDVRTRDVLYLVMSESVKLAFEVVGTETTLNVPPYTVRYVCNRRAELDVTDGALSGWQV